MCLRIPERDIAFLSGLTRESAVNGYSGLHLECGNLRLRIVLRRVGRLIGARGYPDLILQPGPRQSELQIPEC